MLEELPVVIKNSHLVNVMLAELTLEGCAVQRSSYHLELGTRRFFLEMIFNYDILQFYFLQIFKLSRMLIFCRSLEKCLRSLMGDVDDLNRTVMAYTKYMADKQRYDLTVYNAMQKRVTGVLFLCGLINCLPI